MSNNDGLLSQLPKYFDVGWVKFKFNLKTKLKDSEGTACFGLVDFQNPNIWLDDAMVGEVARATVIHECFHCLFETLGLGATTEGSDSVVTTNEILTETSTRAVTMFQNLNPELWELLFNK